VARFLATGQVGWAGTTLGLMPLLSPTDERLAAEFDERDIPALLDALDDETRFVKAHVALTRLSGVEYEAFPEWSGLPVDISADADVHIDVSARPTLARRWHQWYDSEPRPPRLPR
jgi:hypothetical protein